MSKHKLTCTSKPSPSAWTIFPFTARMDTTQLVARRPQTVQERMGKWPHFKWFADKEGGSTGFGHLEELLPWRVLWLSVRSNQHTPPAPPSHPVGGLCNHWIFCGTLPPTAPPITHRRLPLSLACSLNRSLSFFRSSWSPAINLDSYSDHQVESGKYTQMYSFIPIHAAQRSLSQQQHSIPLAPLTGMSELLG